DHAETNPGRFSLLDLPGTLTPGEAMLYRAKLVSSRAALYYPDLKVIDPADQSLFSLPPSCAMAGVISERDLTHGSYFPPGNRFIEGAVALSRSLTKDETAALYEKGINSFKKVPGKGITVWGVRTLSDDPQWRFINVRRTVTLLSRAIKQGTAWAVFEPNDKALKKRLVRHVTAYLIDVWRKGYLSGKTPEEAFYVRCDGELNPPGNIDLGILTIEVGLCVVKPAEFIVVTLHARKEHTKVIIDEEVIHG
ncbi:MAG: phage tail sheath family protein, partial [Spirochaetales bacterium]|nr:phage tail sheath family protein [Spirochaetales bacterium]